MYSFERAPPIIAVKEKYIQILGIALTAVYGLFIVFLYAAEPRSLAEVPTKARTTIENAATTGQVIIGTYKIDQAKFDAGLIAFRQDNFVSPAISSTRPTRKNATLGRSFTSRTAFTARAGAVSRATTPYSNKASKRSIA